MRKLTSVFTQLKTGIGFRLHYDGRGGRVYVQLDSQWRGQTLGLCGTYNGNLRDDFLWACTSHLYVSVENVTFAENIFVGGRSPAGMIEGTPQLHASAWKVSSACVAPVNLPITDPCEMNQHNGNSFNYCGFGYYSFILALMKKYEERKGLRQNLGVWIPDCTMHSNITAFWFELWIAQVLAAGNLSCQRNYEDVLSFVWAYVSCSILRIPVWGAFGHCVCSVPWLHQSKHLPAAVPLSGLPLWEQLFVHCTGSLRLPLLQTWSQH